MKPGRTRIALLGLLIGLFASAAGPAAAQSAATPAAATLGQSGLQVPRYVSLKSDRVHARQGPGTDYKVLWIYRRAGLPIEVIKEFEGWRQVRDSDGAEGWVLQSLISGRRTGLVLPWEIKDGQGPKVELLSEPKAGAAPVVIVEAGVIANIRTCDKTWCYVSVGDLRGYVEQKKLWGVYPGETVK